MSISDGELGLRFDVDSPIPFEIKSAASWIDDITDAEVDAPDRKGKFVAINEFVVFAPQFANHVGIYKAAMHEDSPFRDEVMEQVEQIRQNGLVTLKSTFVTDAGEFRVYPDVRPESEGGSIAEINDKSFHLGRADFEGRSRTVDHVRHAIADIGLSDIEVRHGF